MWYNAITVIPTSVLQWTDDDTVTSELVFTLVDTQGRRDSRRIINTQSGLSVATFTQQEVNNGEIAVVISPNAVSDSSNALVFVYTLTDGGEGDGHTKYDTLHVRAQLLSLMVTTNSIVVVPASNTMQLTTRSLQVGFNVPDVSYEITYRIVEHPTHGFITVNRQLASEFSQSDLRSRTVRYHHNDSLSWAPHDELVLFVYSPDEPVATNVSDLRIDISIEHPTAENSALAANSPIDVSENGYANINDTHLQAGNVEALVAYQQSLQVEDLAVCIQTAGWVTSERSNPSWRHDKRFYGGEGVHSRTAR